MAVAMGTIALAGGAAEKVKRFDIHQIVQHAGLMGSFILLVLTGLPMKYADLALSRWWAGVLGGGNALRSVHHLSAYIMVVVCAYHALYIFYSVLVLKKPFPVSMIPGRQDFTRFFQEFLFFIGLRRDRPDYDRYNWREKFDYWAIFWGVPVMAGSGFILMYPVLVTRFLPGWVVPAALAAHSDEAMLALSWIFLVHIFFNHFVPGVFPINTSIFTGKVSLERYRKDHSLEYRRLLGPGSIEAVSEAVSAGDIAETAKEGKEENEAHS